MLERLILEKLVSEVEAKAAVRMACANANAAVARETEANARLLEEIKILTRQRDQRNMTVTTLEGLLAAETERLQRERHDKNIGLPKLAALYEKADALCRLLKDRKNTRPVERAAAAVQDALHDAFNYCDQIPF